MFKILAQAVALNCFRAASGAGEPDLLVTILDVDSPDAHRRGAAVTLWKQHTRVGGHRLSRHIPSLRLVTADRDSMRGEIRTGGETGPAGPVCCSAD
jgi:hypothetical protein